MGCRSTNTPRYATDFTSILASPTLESTYRLVGHEVIADCFFMLNAPHVWYVNFASEMKVFGLVGGVRVYMVVFKAHKYGQYHRN